MGEMEKASSHSWHKRTGTGIVGANNIRRVNWLGYQLGPSVAHRLFKCATEQQVAAAVAATTYLSLVGDGK